MKSTLIAFTTSLTLIATPMLAGDDVKLTTTKSTQAGVAAAASISTGAMAAVVAGIIVVGIAAGSGSSGGT